MGPQTEQGWRKELDSVQRYPAGINLFMQGALPSSIFLIEKGIVKLLRAEIDGKEAIVALRFPGWFLGATAIIMNGRYQTTAVTQTKCDLWRIPSQTFLRLVHSDSELSWRLLRLHSEAVVESFDQIGQLGCLSSRERLLRLLWRFGAVTGLEVGAGETRLILPFRHREIAEIIAVTPEHLSRLFKRLEEDGAIRSHKGWLFLRRNEADTETTLTVA